ncbi:MAG TPA: PaaI family thioesterase, partial [Thermoleophilaceae bacterium]|nr:PaaI family thioesterase [Thermoleophilaceae bacterium]
LTPGHREGHQALRRRSAAGAGGLTNPAITPELFRRGIAGSFPGNLGIEVVRIEDDEVEGRLEVDDRHLHPGGYVHGGVWVAFADTVAAWGTFRHLQEGHDFTTAELKANVFAAGRTGDVLTAIGKPLHVGRRTQVWEVLIQKEGRNAAFFSCTQMILAPA